MVHSLGELMNYFEYSFFIYYLTVPVVAYNIYRYVKKKTSIVIDFILQILFIIAIVQGFIFQGALADISNSGYMTWLYQLLFILLIHVIFNNVYLSLYFSRRK